jgi:hypothetical protein
MTQTSNVSIHPTIGKETAASYPRITPIAAIRANCLECGGGGSFKSVLWCTCDGVHSSRCHFWPYRFGCRPETIAERYDPARVTPDCMPGSDVCEDDLPNGMEAAAAYLACERTAAHCDPQEADDEDRTT